jgi:uncharacterized membrane protein
MKSVKMGSTTMVASNSTVIQKGIVDTGSSNLCIPSTHYNTIMAHINGLLNYGCNGA